MEPKEKMLPAEQGIYTLLGFAQKAGCLLGGGDMVIQAANKGKLKLILLAWDLSENSYRRFCQSVNLKLGNVQVWRFGDKQQLGRAAGKPPRGIWALQEPNFCQGLTKKLEQLHSLAPELASPADLKKS